MDGLCNIILYSNNNVRTHKLNRAESEAPAVD